MLDLAPVQIMGVINITPDSFSEIGRIQQIDLVLQYANKLIAEGASIIDIGAEPTNPSLARKISLQEELDRIMLVLERLLPETAVPISVDTSKPQVMREAIKQGVKIINDVRAFREEGALAAVANTDVKLCLMHMSFPFGKSSDIATQKFEPDVMTVVKDFLIERINACEAVGINRERMIIDPGIGFGNFGKSTADNLKLLNQLSQLQTLELPILVGVSRKTFIGEILKQSASERLIGSLAAGVIAVYNGATIIRTHDVKETLEAMKIAVEIRNAN